MSIEVKNIKVNNMTDPIGINARAPEISWQVSGNGQSAYQIIAAASETELEQGVLLWDSGKVADSRTFGHRYGGSVLQSRDRVCFKVRLWNADDVPGNWSRTASFEIGLSDESAWSAQYLGFPGGWAGKGLYFSSHFQFAGVVGRARCYFTGNWSEIFINGEKLGGDAVLQPSQTDFSKSIHYLTFDIAPFLRQGENVIAIHTGNGWYGTPVIRYQLENDGNLLTMSHIYSLPSVYPSPVTRNSIFDGEEFDARLECDPAWKLPGNVIFPLIRNSMRISGPAGVPRGLEEEPVRPVREIKPVDVKKIGENHYSVDFGENFAGYCRLKLCVPRGTRIELIFAESRYDDLRANQENLLGAAAREIYTANGNPGGEVYEPHFTYHGFRYVEVIGLPGEFTPETLTGIAIMTDCRDTGKFVCSDALANDIFAMIKRTESSNLLAVPTDCPQRTERMGWLNDLMARCETGLYLYDESNVLTKWLRDIAEAQDKVTGEVPMTAPLYWGFQIDPVCSSFVEAAWLNYAFYGKYDLLEELYPNMCRWIDCMIGSCDDDGIFRKGGFVGDWCPPVGFNNGHSSAQNHTVPHEMVSTAIMHYAVKLLARIARIIGKDDDAAALDEKSAKICGDFQRTWRTGHGKLSVRSQSAYAYAIYCGLFPGEEEAAAAELAGIFREYNCKHATGNIGTRYLLEVLSSYGYADMVWQLISSEDYPGWGYMLANGATTLWERWELATGYGMNSHNHPMLGCPGAWFFRHAAGIQIAEDTAGFENFILSPKFFTQIEYAGADYESRMGLIRSYWKRDNGKVIYDFEIPYGARALVILPGREDQWFDGGKYQIVC